MTPGGTPRRRGPGVGATAEAGFTLVEVIVVMAILGLVLGLLGMRGPVRSDRLDLDSAAQELAGSLRLARSRAIAQNRAVAVALGPGSYSLDGGPPRPLRATVAAADATSIAFAPSGGSSGGTVTLQAGQRQVAVRVEWLTGRVTVGNGR
jgi:general secretion pathway protein H